MKRKDFLIESGKLITVAMFVQYLNMSKALASSNSSFFSEDSNNHKRPQLDSLATPALKAIALGINAPSPHNTQSWKFKILNNEEFLFYVDENKLLPATDPPSRQIHIGAGCFLETLSIGVTVLGYKALANYFPEGYNSVADFGKKPVAKIKLEKSSEIKNELSDYISLRQTNRRIYSGNIVSESLYNEVKSLAGNLSSHLQFINEPSSMSPYLDLLYEAMKVETLTYRTSEETRKMFRFSEKERAEKGDGISIPQMGYSGMIAGFAERSLKDGDEKVWHSDKSNNSGLEHFKKGLDSAKGIVFFISDKNDFIDWIESGRDFIRFALASTKKELYLHPCNQAIQEYEEMKEIRNNLDKMLGTTDTQKIQMIARIGHSSTPYYSYRRELKNFLMKE